MGKLTINSTNLLDEDLKVELKEESWGVAPQLTVVSNERD
jgi:hypothetical protein